MANRIVNQIESVTQTPDACVTACLDACLRGMNRSLDDLLPYLAPYKVPAEIDNPTDNPLYFYPDGIMKVLAEHDFYVGAHISGDQKLEGEIYKGYDSKLSLKPPEYLKSTFTERSFNRFLHDNLERERYLLVWLDNPIYSPEGYVKNGYRQHVVVVYGIDLVGEQAMIMDPDTYLDKNLLSMGLGRLYNSLWRRSEHPRAMERVIVLGPN